MDPRVRDLYKRLIFLSRGYPRGITEARRKLQAAFRAAKGSIDEPLAKGEYVARELEALTLAAMAAAPELVGEAAGGAQLSVPGEQQADSARGAGLQQQQGQQAGGPPSFCERETLSGLLRQFVVRQEGFDSGLQVQRGCTAGDGRFLDPTDYTGQPSPYPQPGWPWPLPTDVLLSYVNEPPKGSPGTNATVEDGAEAGELLFVACADIMQGAELLIDYGFSYDSKLASNMARACSLAVVVLALAQLALAAPRNPRTDEDILPGWMGTDFKPDLIEPDSIAHRTSKMKVLDAEFDGLLSYYRRLGCSPEQLQAAVREVVPPGGPGPAGGLSPLAGQELMGQLQLAAWQLLAAALAATALSVYQSRPRGWSRQDLLEVRSSNIAGRGVFARAPIPSGTVLGAYPGRLRSSAEMLVKSAADAASASSAASASGRVPIISSQPAVAAQLRSARPWDYFFHKDGITNGGNRYATVLMYLVDTEEGGETVFPNVAAPGGENAGFSECARYHLAARPRKGTAILFHSIKPTGELERKSLHTACPVIKGTKWSAAKWIHVGHYAMGSERPELIEQHPQPKVKAQDLPPGCEDSDDMCPDWAESGECERNLSFMVGSRARPGKCVASCKRCDLVLDTGAEGTQDAWRKANQKSTGASRRSLVGRA
ncbi:Prolyl 4-hydroxylase subunit alpha-1 [Tetrabaena socialis]|uniref:Prolyl 4-hydroxylase subunit alpha-1 n=1 Tax=Tetrabaena socialis TaxID=47790 RepID=A0A2J7ZN39_9CHLO|nr:Prolyl 4-hydroxylase subunit alpha-1 [Tetrabaena socialis]|eukprot:PNH01678.1 Prolyl 4-hydroxylase subunit alpha-1 [Tetrabaena socialis]